MIFFVVASDFFVVASVCFTVASDLTAVSHGGSEYRWWSAMRGRTLRTPQNLEPTTQREDLVRPSGCPNKDRLEVAVKEFNVSYLNVGT